MSIFSCLDFIEDIPVLGQVDEVLSNAIDDFGNFITGESSSSSSSSDYDDYDDDDIDDIIRDIDDGNDDDYEYVIIRRRRRH